MGEHIALKEIRSIYDLRVKTPILKRAVVNRLKKALIEPDGPIGMVGLHNAGKSAVVRSILGENDVYIQTDTIDGIIRLNNLVSALDSEKNKPATIVLEEATVLVSSNVDSTFMQFRNMTNTIEHTLELIDHAKRNNVKVLMIYHSVLGVPDKIRKIFGIGEEIVIPVTFTEDEMQQICGCDGLFPRIGIEVDGQTQDLLMKNRFVPMIPPLLRQISINPSRLSTFDNIAGDQVFRITRRLTENQIEELVSLFEGRSLPSEHFRSFVELGLVEPGGRLLDPIRDYVAPMSEKKAQFISS